MSRVFLWSSHRCASTVFERSIQELNTVKSLHEPHCLAYFREDGSIRDDDDTDSVFEGKRGYILSQARGSEDYIVKELAYYISGSKGEFAQFKHTFLIRHPKAVAVSLHNVMKAHDQKVPFFTDTKELYNTYEAVKLTDANPIVISAEDLLSKPREVMEMYCREAGLPYTEDMLTWEPKVFPDWKQYPKYYIWHEMSPVVLDSNPRKQEQQRSHYVSKGSGESNSIL